MAIVSHLPWPTGLDWILATALGAWYALERSRKVPERPWLALSLALATGAETVCAGLLALGLFTRLNAIPLVITMLVAAFWAHGVTPMG